MVCHQAAACVAAAPAHAHGGISALSGLLAAFLLLIGVADVPFMKLLVQRGASLSAKNAQGLTALEFFLQRHGDRPIVMRPFRSAFPDAVPRRDTV